jgi:integrase
MDSTQDIILKNGTRILTPTEYEKMRAAMIRPDVQPVLDAALESGDIIHANKIRRYQIICDALLLTGMRYVEFADLERSWYSGPRRVIQIPKSDKRGKKKCLYTERTVMLSLPGCDAVERYLNSGLRAPHRVSMYEALHNYARWSGIGETGITPKMFRKTFISWAMAAFPEMAEYIGATVGHSAEVMRRHYLVTGFPSEELRKIREVYMLEWGKRL